MEKEYSELDDLAAPDNYVARPTEEDIEYVKCFVKTCRRYNIDFATASPEEREFVLKMANKSMDLKEEQAALHNIKNIDKIR